MENKIVKLKVKGTANSKKSIPQEFDREHAIRVLSLKNSRWELSEPGMEWNGKDIVSKKSEK